MDCEQDCNISIEKTINFINNHTVYKNGHTYNIKTNNIVRAITVVHVFGNSIRFSELLNLCKVRNIKIIEDAAESLGSYNNEFNQKIHTGGIGDIGCFSFNGNKIITTGGGGAIASHSKELIDKARYLINQAKDDPVFYIHNEVGFNYRLSNLSAAMGQAQIENLDKILLQKSKIHTIYCNLLDSSKMLSIIHPSSHSISNFWLNVISIHKKSFNLRLVIDKMFEAGIEVRPIWHANNLQSVFSHHESFQIELAPSIISSSLCLPSSFSLTEDQQYYIINTLQDILN
jgi:dTDP-4-amino-4,6-dideoxygalactose transaminase